MSGLQERITEAIAAHRTQLTFAPAGYWTCACGFAYKNRVPNEHAAHVAAAVIAALNLTEEQRTLEDGWVGNVIAGITPEPLVVEQQRRWVTGWEPS